MILSQPIGWWNTGFPMLILGALALVLPFVLHRPRSVSHLELAVVIGASAGGLLVLSGGLFASIYHWQGAQVGAALAEAPLATTRFFLARGIYAAVLWGPLLGLMWLNLAQGVEAERARQKRKEEDP